MQFSHLGFFKKFITVELKKNDQGPTMSEMVNLKAMFEDYNQLYGNAIFEQK